MSRCCHLYLPRRWPWNTLLHICSAGSDNSKSCCPDTGKVIIECTSTSTEPDPSQRSEDLAKKIWHSSFFQPSTPSPSQYSFHSTQKIVYYKKKEKRTIERQERKKKKRRHKTGKTQHRPTEGRTDKWPFGKTKKKL